MRDYTISVSSLYVINKYKAINQAAGDVIAKLIHEIQEQAGDDPKADPVVQALSECYLQLTRGGHHG